jgi:hypothetical protein
MSHARGRFVEAVRTKYMFNPKVMTTLGINLIWVSYYFYSFVALTSRIRLPVAFFQVFTASILFVGAISYGLLVYKDSKNKSIIYSGKAAKSWDARFPRILESIGFGCIAAGVGAMTFVLFQVFLF